MRFPLTLVIGSLLLAGFGFAPLDEPSSPDDVAIKDVMQQVMKGGMLKKVMSGNASDEEKLIVLDMFISLSESEALQGDADEWKDQTGAVMTSYAKFLVGREGADEALKAATNCKACHDKFKPE